MTAPEADHPQRVYVASEVRMHLDSTGRVRAKHSAAAYNSWTPFIAAFGHINLVARLDTAETSDQGLLVEGPGVTVCGLPYYHGLRKMLVRIPSVIRAVNQLGSRQDLFVGRLPEVVSLVLYRRARILRGRFVSMVVSEPDQIFRAHLPGPAGRLVGALVARATRRIVQRSHAVVYVTQHWLQNLYPAAPGTPVLARSNVVLPPEGFVNRAREQPGEGVIRLVSIGTLEATHKGFDFLVDVVARARATGLETTLDIVGEGAMAETVRQRAVTAGIAEHVRFRGQVHDVVKLRTILDDADVYVSGSRVEGLPRATVEAMARGLPVVSTCAGGISELVDAACLTEVDDVETFVAHLQRLRTDPLCYVGQSAQNLERARSVAELADPARLTDFLSAL